MHPAMGTSVSFAAELRKRQGFELLQIVKVSSAFQFFQPLRWVKESLLWERH